MPYARHCFLRDGEFFSVRLERFHCDGRSAVILQLRQGWATGFFQKCGSFATSRNTRPLDRDKKRDNHNKCAFNNLAADSGESLEQQGGLLQLLHRLPTKG